MKPRYGHLTKALSDERKLLLILRQMGAGKAASQPSPAALQHFHMAGAALGAGAYKKAVASCVWRLVGWAIAAPRLRAARWLSD